MENQKAKKSAPVDEIKGSVWNFKKITEYDRHPIMAEM